jgi:thiol-disulfide isomerase/thioredoxin
LPPLSRLLPLLLAATLACLAAERAAALTDAERNELEALREGDMRKLVVHPEPMASSDVVFVAPDGGEARIADTGGKVRLLNFWATWCAPCRQEKPTLDALQREFGGPDFAVIAVATGRNDPDAIERFNDDLGITALDTWRDPETALAGAMRVPGLPVTVVLDRDGMEVARLMGGADWTSPSARAVIGYLIGLPD